MPRVPFAINSYQHDSLPLSAQQVVNWYAETQPVDAKTRIALLPHPRLKAFGTVGTGPIRGSITMAGVLYIVSGSKLYSVDASGVETEKGSIGVTSTGLITAKHNGTQLVIVNDNDGYVYDRLLDTVVKITDPAFQATSAVGYLDGYHIFTVLNTDQWFISALRDPTSYDGLDFATAEGEPDALVNIAVNSRQLYLCGTRTIEVWYNSGNEFPFDRLSGAYIPKGLGAKNSIVNMDNTLFWLADDKKVYRLDGFTPTRISTHAIEQRIAKTSTFGDAEGGTFTKNGHDFYTLSFPNEVTFVYDAATRLWHNRKSYGRDDFKGCCIIEAYGNVVVAQRDGDELYTLSDSAFLDDGDPMVCLAVSSPFYAAGERAEMGEFEAIFETGVGTTTGQGSDPKAMMRYSDDGGKTWSSRIERSIGEIGDYEKTVTWNRLGDFNTRVVEVSVSDPVGPVLLGANAEIQA